MRVGVALGSNLGDRLENLRRARTAILDLPGVREPLLSSSVYSTAPVDCEDDAGEFLNAVLEFEYDGDARQLLSEFRGIEEKMGRTPNHRRNVSRTIDLDLLYAGALKLSEPGLEIPHPRLAGRRFVLEPLAQIRPDLVLPGQIVSVSELLTRLDKSDYVRPLTGDW